MNRLWMCLVAIVFAITPTCAIAQSALIDVSHGVAGGVVVPGQVVRFAAVLSLQTQPGSPVWLHHASGGITVSPNEGQASGFTSPFVPSGGQIWNAAAASPSGGAMMGFVVSFPIPPIGVIFHPPIWTASEVELFSYDWEAPTVATPTVFDLAWEPDPRRPLVEFWLHPSGAPVQVPTIYTGTSILVVPAPAVSSIALCAVGLAGRRRPRPQRGR